MIQLLNPWVKKFYSLRGWREWMRARNFLRRSCERNSHFPCDLGGFLHSRSEPKFAQVLTPASMQTRNFKSLPILLDCL